MMEKLKKYWVWIALGILGLSALGAWLLSRAAWVHDLSVMIVAMVVLLLSVLIEFILRNFKPSAARKRSIKAVRCAVIGVILAAWTILLAYEIS